MGRRWRRTGQRQELGWELDGTWTASLYRLGVHRFRVRPIPSVLLVLPWPTSLAGANAIPYLGRHISGETDTVNYLGDHWCELYGIFPP